MCVLDGSGGPATYSFMEMQQYDVLQLAKR